MSRALLQSCQYGLKCPGGCGERICKLVISNIDFFLNLQIATVKPWFMVWKLQEVGVNPLRFFWTKCWWSWISWKQTWSHYWWFQISRRLAWSHVHMFPMQYWWCKMHRSMLRNHFVVLQSNINILIMFWWHLKAGSLGCLPAGAARRRCMPFWLARMFAGLWRQAGSPIGNLWNFDRLSFD